MEQLTQRELGRLRKKKALLAKIQEQEQEQAQLKCAESETAGEDAEGQPEMKRTRSEGGVEDDGRDVEMKDS